MRIKKEDVGIPYDFSVLKSIIENDQVGGLLSLKASDPFCSAFADSDGKLRKFARYLMCLISKNR
jgi:hypothetical protein